MDLVKALATALDLDDFVRAALLLRRIEKVAETTGFKPTVAPFRYWIIVAKMPEASGALRLGDEEEERRSVYFEAI